MQCPHCLNHFFEKFERRFLDSEKDKLLDKNKFFFISFCKCPACEKVIIKIIESTSLSAVTHEPSGEIIERIVIPKSTSRKPLPKEVPDNYRNDYLEACLVLSDSPKASAALSRRCLQAIIREESKTKKRDLDEEIEELLNSPGFPTYIAELLHHVRIIGNFAAHSTKSKNTGEIIEVEPGEAEINLGAIESLFDFYFVQPINTKRIKDELNKKLKEAGKDPLD